MSPFSFIVRLLILGFSLVDFRTVTDEIRRVEAELDQWATASVASVFKTISDQIRYDFRPP
jgi:hypothetical protein